MKEALVQRMPGHVVSQGHTGVTGHSDPLLAVLLPFITEWEHFQRVQIAEYIFSSVVGL